MVGKPVRGFRERAIIQVGDVVRRGIWSAVNVLFQSPWNSAVQLGGFKGGDLLVGDLDAAFRRWWCRAPRSLSIRWMWPAGGPRDADTVAARHDAAEPATPGRRCRRRRLRPSPSRPAARGIRRDRARLPRSGAMHRDKGGRSKPRCVAESARIVFPICLHQQNLPRDWFPDIRQDLPARREEPS